MKKVFALAALFALSAPAFAGFQSASGNAGAKSANTVAQAKKAYDDTYVTLRGNIIARVGEEKYTFKDKTGSIRVEIDDELWGGLNVSPANKVTVYGKVDRDNGRVEIDVKRISK